MIHQYCFSLLERRMVITDASSIRHKTSLDIEPLRRAIGIGDTHADTGQRGTPGNLLFGALQHLPANAASPIFIADFDILDQRDTLITEGRIARVPAYGHDPDQALCLIA